MRHSIRELSKPEAVKVIYEHGFNVVDGFSELAMQECLNATSRTWVGVAEDRVACMWGVVIPSLLSNRAYLWLSTTDALIGNEFRFARHSQMVVQSLLEQYPEVIGHVRAGHDRSIRWLKWLKAELGEPEGMFVPFVIRKRN